MVFRQIVGKEATHNKVIIKTGIIKTAEALSFQCFRLLMLLISKTATVSVIIDTIIRIESRKTGPLLYYSLELLVCYALFKNFFSNCSDRSLSLLYSVIRL